MIKKILFSLAIVSMMASSLIFTACGDDNDELSKQDDKELADPEGTAIASIVYNINIDNKYTGYGSTVIDGFSDLYLEGINIKSAYGYSDFYIASVGKVRGLADVKTIPTSGWNHTAGVIPGYGYVARRVGYYARLYIIDYVRDAAGNIIGITFKYQFPFVVE